MSADTVTIWAYAVLAAIVTNGIIVAFIFGPQAIKEWGPLLARAITMCRLVLTKAGDGRCGCDRWTLTAFCPSCDERRVMTTTGTVATAPAEKARLRGLWETQRATLDNVTHFEPHRRARIAFDRLKPRRNQAVN